MRWFESPPKLGPSTGEYRIRKGFLFLPKKIRGEWRWLESACWTEQYCLDWVGSFSGTRYYHFTVEDFNRAYSAGMRAAQVASEAQLNALMREGTAFRCVNCGTVNDINK